MDTLRTFRSRWLWPLLVLPFAAACGTPTAPDAGQTPEEPGDTIDTAVLEPPMPGTPLLPVPSGPLVDAPETSDTLTLIVPLTADYRPLVSRMNGVWRLSARQCLLGFCVPWVSPDPTSSWSDALGGVKVGILDVPMQLEPPVGRVLLVEDGTPVDVVRWESSSSIAAAGTARWYRVHRFVGKPLNDVVYLRRDRYWELLPISSGVGSYLILTGDTQAELSTEYTSGTTTTETESFGRSLTASVGLSLGPLNAGVEATISESYSTSVSITESVSETFTRIARGSVGKTTRFMIWGLVERYTFSDENGDPIMHPDYQIVPDVLYRRGVATALQATEFPG